MREEEDAKWEAEEFGKDEHTVYVCGFSFSVFIFNNPGHEAVSYACF